MLNISKSDPNIPSRNDVLGMLRQGANDLNRYYYVHGKHNHPIPNRTDNIFNHTRSTTGGYYSGGTFDHTFGPIDPGGIVPFPVPKQTQNIANENSNHPVPVINALVDASIHPIISHFVDAPLPFQFNPIAVR